MLPRSGNPGYITGAPLLIANGGAMQHVSFFCYQVLFITGFIDLWYSTVWTLEIPPLPVRAYLNVTLQPSAGLLVTTEL